jgi:DNA invertase Pin-like site-specific DNA recombinase
MLGSILSEEVLAACACSTNMGTPNHPCLVGVYGGGLSWAFFKRLKLLWPTVCDARDQICLLTNLTVGLLFAGYEQEAASGSDALSRQPEVGGKSQSRASERAKRWTASKGKEPMKVALYLRVSTDKQETENQAVELRDFAAKQGWQITREYCDFESGAKADRAAFKQMFEDASRRKFDLVLFWALDRLSREGVLQTLTYLNRLESYGIGFRSYTEQFFDSCGPFKDAVIGIMATLAKQERIKRSERTRAGLARVKASGRVLGRPKSIKATAGDVACLRAAGRSYRAIGSELGISLRSVQRLARP